VLYIKRQCAPFPAPGLNGPPPAAGVPAVPDVAITLGGRGGPRVEVIEAARLALRVNPGYARLAARGTGQELRDHASGLVRRADWFIARLDERFSTIRQVVEHPADRQPWNSNS
jgi:DNA-directed RNA polymerase specialized sigma54-like protein